MSEAKGYEAKAEDYASDKPQAMYGWGQEKLGKSVWEAGLERMEHIYDTYDHVVIMFSGGKDSMCCLETAYQVAEERGRLPLTVLHSDDEIMAPPTEDYVRRVANRPGIDLHWVAVPMKQRNAASSSEESMWYPWGREAQDQWVRQPPPEAIQLEDLQDWYTDPLGLDGTGDGDPADRPTFQQFMSYYAMRIFPKGRIAQVIGVRAGESLLRRKSVSNLREDNYIINEFKRVDKVYPVYDWTTHDIWTLTAQRGWDYCETYDYFEMRGVSPNNQRIGTPFGTEAIRDIKEWSETFPEVWDRIIDRVPGAESAARYSRTELYAFQETPQKPEDMEWMDFIKSMVERHEDKRFRDAAYVALNKMIKRHFRQASEPILEYPHPRSGLSWGVLAKVASRGDAKDRTVAQVQRGNPEKYAQALNEYRKEQKAKRNSRKAKGADSGESIARTAD